MCEGRGEGYILITKIDEIEIWERFMIDVWLILMDVCVKSIIIASLHVHFTGDKIEVQCPIFYQTYEVEAPLIGC